MTHQLPSARHIADFHGFFTSATVHKNGTCTIALVLPKEMVAEILKFSDQDGMALNVSVWETRLPDLDDVDDELARALGGD